MKNRIISKKVKNRGRLKRLTGLFKKLFSKINLKVFAASTWSKNVKVNLKVFAASTWSNFAGVNLKLFGATTSSNFKNKKALCSL